MSANYISTFAYAFYKANKLNPDPQNTYELEKIEKQAKAAGISPNQLGVYLMENQPTLEAQFKAEQDKQPKN